MMTQFTIERMMTPDEAKEKAKSMGLPSKVGKAIKKEFERVWEWVGDELREPGYSSWRDVLKRLEDSLWAEDGRLPLGQQWDSFRDDFLTKHMGLSEEEVYGEEGERFQQAMEVFDTFFQE